MKTCILYAGALIGLLAFSAGAYACNPCDDGAEDFSSEVGATITATSSAFAVATGQYTETHAYGGVAGDGWISRPGVDVSGSFQADYDANASREDYGQSQSQGGALGGLSLNVSGGHGERGFSAANVEKSQALASGGQNDTSTWTSGALDGSAWLDMGKIHGETNAHSANQSEDHWPTDSHSKGAAGVLGKIRIELQRNNAGK